MAPYPGIATRIPRPGRSACDRTQEASRDRSVVAARKGAASGNKIGERSTIDGDLEDTSVMARFQVVVMPKTDADSVVVRWNEDGGRIQSRISHTTWSIMEYGVGRVLR